MRRADGPAYDARAIERYVLGGGGAEPTVRDLALARLAPYAYTQLASGDGRRTSLRPYFLAACATHLAAKAALRGLLAAWRSAGIEALIVKGFHLAEFIYPHPAQRRYADVDIVIRPERTADALALARTLGWRIPWERQSSVYHHNHEEAILTRDGMLIEVQRYVIDSLSPNDTVPRKMTLAGWARARSVTLSGTPVWVLDPLDAILMGIVQARAWSAGDRWVIRPSDYLDMALVAERFKLTREDLLRRADELGCARTLDLFLRVCDPWRRSLTLVAPTRLQLAVRYLAMTPERGHLGLEWRYASLRRLPQTARDTACALPWVLAQHRRGGREPPPRLAAPVLDAEPKRLSLREKERLVRGIKWATRLVQPVGDRCHLRSWTLAEALRAQGVEVTLHSADEPAAGATRTHYWIETPDFVLRDLESEPPCQYVSTRDHVA